MLRERCRSAYEGTDNAGKSPPLTTSEVGGYLIKGSYDGGVTDERVKDLRFGWSGERNDWSVNED